MDGMKAVRFPRDRPHRTRVPQDRVRRQRHRSREPGYPRKSNLPGIQEIAWLVRDPCPQQSASSDPPANHSRDSHETRRFYTVWVKLGHPGDVRCMTVLPPKAEVHPRCCYVADVPQPDIPGSTSTPRSRPKTPRRFANLSKMRSSNPVGTCGSID